MNTKIISQVYQTSDYSMFKTLKGNRKVSKAHVLRLRKSMEKNLLLTIIIVNELFEIIDGQHRFEVLKELKLPVTYVIITGYGLNEVRIFNAGMSNWGNMEYLNSFCDLGFPEYLKFRNFMRRFPDFNISSSDAILTDILGSRNKRDDVVVSETNKNGSYKINSFKDGELVIPNYEKSIENAEMIMMLKPYFDRFNDTLFVRAMLGIFRLEYYSHARMIDRIKANPTRLQKCANVTQYKILLEDIYNFRSREKVSLRF